MDKLRELKESFNESFEDITTKFTLTNSDHFLKNAATMVLAVSLSSGAFAASDVKDFAKEGSDSYKLSEQIYENVEKFGFTRSLSDDNIRSIIDGETGVFALPDDRIVLITQDYKISGVNPEVEKQLDLLYNAEGLRKKSPVANIIKKEGFFENTAEVNTINLSKDYYESVSKEKDFDISSLVKHGNTFLLGHELNHIYNAQMEYNLAGESTTENHSQILKTETLSDVFGVMFTAKFDDMSIPETNKMLDQLIEYRDKGLDNYGDLRHATSYALENFKTLINENPEHFDKIKSLGIGEMDKELGKLSSSLFDALDDKFEPSDRYESNREKEKRLIQNLVSFKMDESLKSDITENLDDIKPSSKKLSI